VYRLHQGRLRTRRALRLLTDTREHETRSLSLSRGYLDDGVGVGALVHKEHSNDCILHDHFGSVHQPCMCYRNRSVRGTGQTQTQRKEERSKPSAIRRSDSNMRTVVRAASACQSLCPTPFPSPQSTTKQKTRQIIFLSHRHCAGPPAAAADSTESKPAPDQTSYPASGKSDFRPARSLECTLAGSTLVRRLRTPVLCPYPTGLRVRSRGPQPLRRPHGR
jgi:hypothetical protein